VLVLLIACLAPAPARAILDNRDRGPSLTAGNFNLRITNAGIIGNAFLDAGYSNDPSFEMPPGSGHEALNYAALWVGALDDFGVPSVSGGPLLEFRPTLADEDHVRVADRGRLGCQRFVDDDGDGRVDEELLNGVDDDGDGEIDEDLGMFSQQMASADYVDDRPEAIAFGYATGEQHRPLGISVHQEAYAWAMPGYDGIAGLKFTITNHGDRTLHQLYIGVYADLDSRNVNDRAGHLNDRVVRVGFTRTVFEGTSFVKVNGIYPHNCPPCTPLQCNTTLRQTLPAVVDGKPNSGLPMVTVLPLDHTTDPLALLEPFAAHEAARAPGRVSFRSSVFANGRLAGRGGPPAVDADRYSALAGSFPSASEDREDDYVVLVSCGPFKTLAPGQSVDFVAALIAATSLDSLRNAMASAALMYKGEKVNLLPDSLGPNKDEWYVGETGVNGHEICLEPPPGVSFVLDPHCPEKFPPDVGAAEFPTLYTHGHCIWTDADCNECTGLNGFETVRHWLDPGELPPAPSSRLTALDHAARIEWDNMPEILFNAGITLPINASESRFLGYHLWKMQDWRERESLLPERSRWALIGNYSHDTANGETPIDSIVNNSLDYLRILYEQPQYPVGRYAVTDPDAQDGFDYLYYVTSVYEIRQRESNGYLRINRIESAIDPDFALKVVPHAAARADAKSVWVVPNPFKARADWDRPRTLGDQLTRHLDFMGLPRAACSIKIWTVAGDFVVQLEHDGRNGDGEAAWDLVSRNGQEVESGIYLFTVDSALGHQVGRFVVIR
jgi:hypothetical protein